MHITADEESYTVELDDFSKMDQQRYVSIGDGNVNKTIASMHRQNNNGYSACTEYPLSYLPTPSDRCHNRNF